MGRFIDGLLSRKKARPKLRYQALETPEERRLKRIQEHLKKLAEEKPKREWSPIDNFFKVIRRKKRTQLKSQEKIKLPQFFAFNSGSFLKKINQSFVVLAFLVLAGGILIQLPPIKEALLLLEFFRNGQFLVVFQNNQELRPTGGFIGSLAELTTQNFKIKNLWVEPNIYQKDNQFLETHFIPAPAPMREVWPNSYLALASANWSIDFEQTAKELLWYYQQEYEKDVDGVIALNGTLVANLLKLTGPIQLPAYSQTLTPENFFQVLTTEIQSAYWEDPRNEEINKPKLILAETAPLIFKKMEEVGLWKLSQFIRGGLREKEIQLYFKDEQKQLKASKLNWAGRVSQEPSDFLSINNANLGGSKSSQNIQEVVSYQIQTHPQLKAKLKIQRTHRGSGVWPDDTNRNYMRVLTPVGSELSEATLNGQKIDKIKTETESYKTSFGFWVTTAPGQTSQVELEYLLPSWISPYKLVIQKQSGAPADYVEVAWGDRSIFKGYLTQDLEISGIKK